MLNCLATHAETFRQLRLTHPSVQLMAYNTLVSRDDMAACVIALPALSMVKMLDCSGLPCVDFITHDRKQLTLAVDTGNPTSLLNERAAQRLGLTLAPNQTSDGKIVPNVDITSLAETHLGSGALGNLKFAVIDMSKQIADKTFPTV